MILTHNISSIYVLQVFKYYKYQNLCIPDLFFRYEKVLYLNRYLLFKHKIVVARIEFICVLTWNYNEFAKIARPYIEENCLHVVAFLIFLI